MSVYTTLEETDQVREALELALMVLAKGDRLFGETEDSYDHLYWTIRVILSQLQAHREKTEEQPESVEVLLGIGHSLTGGWFVHVHQPE